MRMSSVSRGCRDRSSAARADRPPAPSRTVPPRARRRLAHPDFVYPAVPRGAAADARRRARRSRLAVLQNDDLRGAEREFAAALKRSRRRCIRRTPGTATSRWRGSDYDRALTAFDAALARRRRYVPALVGRGQALLALKREREALAAFEAALAADTSLTDVRAAGRGAALPRPAGRDRGRARRGRRPAGRGARRRTSARSRRRPTARSCYRELGLLERRAGERRAALDAASGARPSSTRPTRRRSCRSASCSRRSRTSPAPRPRIARRRRIEPIAGARRAKARGGRRAAREARLPAEFRRRSPRRADHARRSGGAHRRPARAVLVRRRAERQVVDHRHARALGGAVDHAGRRAPASCEPFENHTFQPRAARPARRSRRRGQPPARARRRRSTRRSARARRSGRRSPT